jgi:hypothetical protein
VATFDDLDALARSMPDTDVIISGDGRPEYRVRGKLFLCHRSPRKDALDADGQRLTDVLMFRTPGLDAKEAILADGALPFFTTEHFDGWPAVLLRIPDLAALSAADLEEAVSEAWLAQAPKTLVKRWLAEHPPP